MLYPTVSDYINQKNQSRAVASYSEEVENLSDVDYRPILTPPTTTTGGWPKRPMPFTGPKR